VAMAAYGNLQKPAGYDGARPGCGPAVGFSASAMADATNSWGFDDEYDRWTLEPSGDDALSGESPFPVRCLSTIALLLIRCSAYLCRVVSPFGDNSKLQSSRLPVPADAASGPTVVPYTVGVQRAPHALAR
jgi:hypothetical protein